MNEDNREIDFDMLVEDLMTAPIQAQVTVMLYLTRKDAELMSTRGFKKWAEANCYLSMEEITKLCNHAYRLNVKQEEKANVEEH